MAAKKKLCYRAIVLQLKLNRLWFVLKRFVLGLFIPLLGYQQFHALCRMVAPKCDTDQLCCWWCSRTVKMLYHLSCYLQKKYKLVHYRCNICLNLQDQPMRTHVPLLILVWYHKQLIKATANVRIPWSPPPKKNSVNSRSKYEVMNWPLSWITNSFLSGSCTAWIFEVESIAIKCFLIKFCANRCLNSDRFIIS